MPPIDTAGQPEALLEIYRKLKRGLGHELVTDDNVFALIDLAQREGQIQLATQLREWQSPCSDGSDGVPSTIAPTRGFNRENAKH